MMMKYGVIKFQAALPIPKAHDIEWTPNTSNIYINRPIYNGRKKEKAT